jgi:hypothetical protein
MLAPDSAHGSRTQDIPTRQSVLSIAISRFDD